jgi:hypothetical protein
MGGAIGVKWLIVWGREGGAKSIMGIGSFHLGRSQVRKRGKIGLNQLLIYIHPFPPLSPQFFYFPSSTQ